MIRLLLLLTPSSSRHESGHEICPPRMVALSDVLWTNKENIDQEDFMDRLAGGHLQLLDALQVRYRPLSP